MTILIVNHNGGSPNHGPNLRTYYAAKNLVKRGHKVTIATSSYSHKYVTKPTIKNDITDEQIDGIDYKWVKTIEYKNLFQRIYSHFQFGFKLIFLRKKIITEKPSVIIFSGPPPEIFLFSYILAKIYKVEIISDIRDLWPMAQLQMSKIYWFNPYVYILFLAQFLIFFCSNKVVSPLSGIAKYTKRFGRNKNIYVIENGYDLDKKTTPKNLILKRFASGEVDQQLKNNEVSLDEIKLNNKFIVGYSGSFDRDNDLDSLISVAKKMRDKDEILFLLVGDGIRREYLIKSVEGLRNVLICNRVESKDVLSVIDAMDVCYCGLRNKKINHYGVALAKTYEYMAASKPIIWMIDGHSNPIKDGAGGLSVEPQNIDQFSNAILSLSKLSKNELEKMGNDSLNYLLCNNSYEVLGEKWERMINEKT